MLNNRREFLKLFGVGSVALGTDRVSPPSATFVDVPKRYGAANGGIDVTTMADKVRQYVYNGEVISC